MEKKKSGTSSVQVNGYVAGWLDSSIQEFLRGFSTNTESAAYALITSLDSTTDLVELWNRNSGLKSLFNGTASIKGSGLLISSDLLEKPGVCSSLFNGFDEVWFFPTPDVEPKPDGVSIVGPHRIDQKTLKSIAPWMETNGCSLALGDGAGLNVIVKAYGPAKHVIGQTLFQPEPTPQMSEMWVEENTIPSSKPRRRTLSHA